MGNRRFWPRLSVTSWQPLLLYGALLAAISTLVWFSLGTLVGGYSPNEMAALQAGDSWRTIFENPLFAPFDAVIRGLMYLTDQHLLATRLAATVFGVATLGVFYLLVRLWHGERTAVIGTLLFAASAWFLHTARLGTPDVVFFSLLVLVAGLAWHKHTDNSFALLLCFALASVLLYVPGMVWLILLGVIWQWRTIDRMFKAHLWVTSLGALLLLAVLAPLGWAVYQDPWLLREWAGFPPDAWPMPLDILRNLAEVPLSLFWSTPTNPEHWLGNLPVLDFFCMAMVFLGGYVYVKHVGLDRSRLIAIVLIAGTLLIALGGAVSLTLIIPFVYILVAAGAGFLLERWYSVFPRNSIAQVTGITLLSLAVLASVAYNSRAYFEAWPNAPATKAVFTIQPDPTSGTIKE